jgi:PTS system nitrogen regulatory IIA component
VRIVDFVSEGAVRHRLEATQPDGVLREIAAALAAACGVEAAGVEAALREREALGCTAIGNEVAVPHAKVPVVRVAGVLALSEPGVAWGAPDGRPVRIVVALALPPRGGKHLEALAAVAKELSEPEARVRLLAAPDAAAVWAVLGAAGGMKKS